MVPLFFSSEAENDFYPGYPHLATDCGVRSALKRETTLTDADFVSNISLTRATVGSMPRQHISESLHASHDARRSLFGIDVHWCHH